MGSGEVNEALLVLTEEEALHLMTNMLGSGVLTLMTDVGIPPEIGYPRAALLVDQVMQDPVTREALLEMARNPGKDATVTLPLLPRDNS